MQRHTNKNNWWHSNNCWINMTMAATENNTKTNNKPAIINETTLKLILQAANRWEPPLNISCLTSEVNYQQSPHFHEKNKTGKCNNQCATLKIHKLLVIKVCIIIPLHIKGSRPEWCISTIYHAWETPFWSGTLDILTNSISLFRSKNLAIQSTNKNFVYDLVIV